MTTVVTSETGGKAKPVGPLYIESDRQVLDGGAATALEQSGLDPTFTADLLSACLAHERCGVHLYRSVAARTTRDDLRERYEQFEGETLEHVRLLEELIASSGGDAQYVSPSARATENAASALVEATFLASGSVDEDTAELAMLEAVMLAEAKDRANWLLLSELVSVVTDSDLRAQIGGVVEPVLAQEEEHYGWAATTRADMVFALATGRRRPAAGSSDVIDLTDMSREDLYSMAQDLEIEGRSQMNKNELAEAVAAAKTGASR